MARDLNERRVPRAYGARTLNGRLKEKPVDYLNDKVDEGRGPGGRSTEGWTPAQVSRYLNDTQRLIDPTIWRRDDSDIPLSRTLPEITELKKLNVGQLGQLLDRFGITEPWPEMRAAHSAYLQRMARYAYGTDQYKAGSEDFLDFSSLRGARMAAKRAYHEYALVTTDTTGNLLRVAEDDKGTCIRCAQLGGVEATLAEHRALGLPGAESCDGGDECRCQLIPTD